MPRPEKQYVSWEERLNQRNQRIQAELFSEKKKLGSDNNDGQQKVEEKEESALEEAKDGGADLGSGTMGMGQMLTIVKVRRNHLCYLNYLSNKNYWQTFGPMLK